MMSGSAAHTVLLDEQPKATVLNPKSVDGPGGGDVICPNSPNQGPNTWGVGSPGRMSPGGGARESAGPSSTPKCSGISASSPLRESTQCVDACMGIRVRDTTMGAALLPSAVLIAWIFVRARYGYSSWQSEYVGGALMLSIGVWCLVATSAQTAACAAGQGSLADSSWALENLSASARLAICTVGIVFSFLLYGYILEMLTTGSELPEVIGIMFNSIVYTAVSYFALKLQGQEKPVRGAAGRYWRIFIFIALSSKLATFLTWRALRYVSFPTQVLAKSCKALPIMVVNRMAGKKHTYIQYISVVLITVGVVVFSWVPKNVAKPDAEVPSLLGMGLVPTPMGLGGFLLLGALFFDGVTGHLEDQVIKEMEWKRGQGTFDLMLQINFYSTPICLLYLVRTP
eukprot:COSAG05_NODE_460_length_9597_cov_8.288798_8_plen_399_part_00